VCVCIALQAQVRLAHIHVKDTHLIGRDRRTHQRGQNHECVWKDNLLGPDECKKSVTFNPVLGCAPRSPIF